jgi:hypothetical protein
MLSKCFTEQGQGALSDPMEFGYLLFTMRSKLLNRFDSLGCQCPLCWPGEATGKLINGIHRDFYGGGTMLIITGRELYLTTACIGLFQIGAECYTIASGPT